MKPLFQIALLAGSFSFAAAQVNAQDQDHKTAGVQVKHDAHVVGHETAKAAVAVGHKTSELAAKGAAAVTDKRYENHWAPGGELVYIDSHSRYYYVNKTGHRNYLVKSQLRDKPLR